MIKPVDAIRSAATARLAPERRAWAPEPPLATAAIIDFSEFARGRHQASPPGDREPDPDAEATIDHGDEEAVARLIEQLLGFPPVARAAQANTTGDRVLDLLR